MIQLAIEGLVFQEEELGTGVDDAAATLNTGTSTIDTVWFGQIGNTAMPPVGWGTTYMDNVDFSAISWIGPINVAAAPAFSPTPGTYSAAQLVNLTDSTTGANIYYTTDGSTPTTASSLYAQAINVSSDLADDLTGCRAHLDIKLNKMNAMHQAMRLHRMR